MRNIREANVSLALCSAIHSPLFGEECHRSVVPSTLKTGTPRNGLWTKSCWDYLLGTQEQHLFGRGKTVVAPYMEDKCWGTMRKRKHKQIPFTKKIPSSRAGAAQEAIYGRSQCATHKLRATRPKCHSRCSTHQPLEQFPSQRLLMSAYVHSSVKKTT